MSNKQKTPSRTQGLSTMGADVSSERAAGGTPAMDRGVGNWLSGRSREAADSLVEFPEPCAMPEQWRNATLWQRYFTSFCSGCQAPAMHVVFDAFCFFLLKVAYLARLARYRGNPASVGVC